MYKKITISADSKGTIGRINIKNPNDEKRQKERKDKYRSFVNNKYKRRGKPC